MLKEKKRRGSQKLVTQNEIKKTMAIARAEIIGKGETEIRKLYVGGVRGGSLYLLIQGRRGEDKLRCSWVVRARGAAGGKGEGKGELNRGLGAYSPDGVDGGRTLAKARERAQQIVTAWNEEGRDIVREEKDFQAGLNQKDRADETVVALFPKWVEFIRGNKTRKYEKDYEVMQARFEKYAAPIIGGKLPCEVTAADVADILRPLALSHPSLMEKIQSFLVQFFRWCLMEENGYRAQEQGNPATTDALAARLPSKDRRAERKGHYPMCPIKDLPRFVRILVTQLDYVGTMGCLFTLLTASRFANVAQSASANQNYAAWADIDLDEKAWLIPAEKMKVPANGGHEVPLSEQALSILQRLKRLGLASGDAVFLNSHGRVISASVFREVIKRVSAIDKEQGGSGFYDKSGKLMTMHGTARASFRSWVTDEGFEPELAEIALHHRHEKLGQAYQRSDAFLRRRDLMQAWADYLFSECPKDWEKVQQVTPEGDEGAVVRRGGRLGLAAVSE